MIRSEEAKWSIFLLLVALSIFFLLRDPATQQSRLASHSSTRSTLKPPVEQSEEIPISILKNSPLAFENIQRNIFEFEEGGTFAAVEPAPQDTMPTMIPDPETMPETPDVRYLGFYRERQGENKKLAAISNGGQIYVGGVGDTLGNKYKVISVEDEYLVLLVLSDHKIVRFPLGEGESVPVVEPDLAHRKEK